MLRPSAVVAGRGTRQPTRDRRRQVVERVRLYPWIRCRVVRVCRVGTQDARVAGIRSERGPVELADPCEVLQGLDPPMLATVNRPISYSERPPACERRPSELGPRAAPPTRSLHASGVATV